MLDKSLFLLKKTFFPRFPYLPRFFLLLPLPLPEPWVWDSWLEPLFAGSVFFAGTVATLLAVACFL
jgi:hypothetical protein